MECKLIYVTVANRADAATLARSLVAERLIACANIVDGVLSIYRWEGKVCEEAEAILIAKTRADRVPAVVERIRSLHDYACPCIVSLPIETGNPPFLEWVVENSSPSE